MDSVLGRQCGSVADFVKGTTAKVANLPQNPQSSHSPTATPRILEESQAECETSCREQQTLESTFQQNAQKSKKVDSRENAQNVENSAKDSSSGDLSLRALAQDKAWQSIYSAPAESNQINGARKACNLESVQGDWGAKGVKKEGGDKGGDFAIQAPLSPLEKTLSQAKLKSSYNAKKVDSSVDCHAASAARNDDKKVDSRNAFFASAKLMDCHASTTALARNDSKNIANKKVDSRGDISLLDKQSAQGRYNATL